MSKRSDHSAADAALEALASFAERLAASLKDRDGFAAVNCPDPTCGVVDRAEALRALGAAGEPATRQFLKRFSRADRQNWPATLLLEAAAGWNRDEVLTGVRQRTQMAIKAYGLLPLPEGEAGRQECLARYLALQKYARESRQFAPQRRTNEQAAVQVALANLAQTAGFPDATRLEWALESQLAAQAAAQRPRKVGDYRVELAGAGLDAEIHVSRAGQPLRSVPDAVHKSAAYAELRAQADELRAQHFRYRATLENLLAEAAPVSGDEWASLARLPVAAAMLKALVFQNEGGATGLFEPSSGLATASPVAQPPPAVLRHQSTAEAWGQSATWRAGTLSGLGGAARAIQGAVRLVHPLQLETAGTLAAWQREIVRRRVVQPFPQVFRARYALLLADDTGAWAVERFVGRRLATRAAAKFLQGRGWLIEHTFRPEVYRTFAIAGLQAVLDFDDLAPAFTAVEEVTCGALCFRPFPAPGPRYSDEPGVPLKDVPPALFSEVLRDCGRLVTAAAPPGAEAPSPPDPRAGLTDERLRARAELVAALVEVLDIRGVTLHEAEAHIHGSGGDFTVHLGSGTICQGAERKTCPVPERWGRSEPGLLLPFPPGGDPQTAEVVGRIHRLATAPRIVIGH